MISQSFIPKIINNQPAIMKTKGEGDCAFHAALGKVDPSTGLVESIDCAAQRLKLAKAIKKCQLNDPLFPLVKTAIMDLGMRGGSMKGKHLQALRIEYKKYEETDNQLIQKKWSTFETQLNKYPDVLMYIKQFQGKDVKQSFAIFEDKDDLTLRALIMSLPELEKAYQVYKQPNQAIHFDEQISNPDLLAEYAEWIAKPGQWLLPCELSMIAYVFEITIEYYANLKAQPELLNPGKKQIVSICFNGHDHYERMHTSTVQVPIKTPKENFLELADRLLDLTESTEKQADFSCPFDSSLQQRRMKEDLKKEIATITHKTFGGRRRICNIGGVYFKFNPDAAHIELAIHALNDILNLNAVAPSTLTHVQLETQSHLLLTALEIKGQTLETLLQNNPDDIQKIEQNSFSHLFILAILTDPEDWKLDNIMACVANGAIRLIGVDNDHAFVPHLILCRTVPKHRVNIKNMLFWFPQMAQPLSKECLKILTELSPEIIIARWMNELKKFNLKNKKSFISLPQEVITQVYHLLTRLKKLAQEQPHATLNEWWLTLNKPVAQYYQALQKKYQSEHLNDYQKLLLLWEHLDSPWKINSGHFEHHPTAHDSVCWEDVIQDPLPQINSLTQPQEPDALAETFFAHLKWNRLTKEEALFLINLIGPLNPKCLTLNEIDDTNVLLTIHNCIIHQKIVEVRWLNCAALNKNNLLSLLKDYLVPNWQISHCINLPTADWPSIIKRTGKLCYRIGENVLTITEKHTSLIFEARKFKAPDFIIEFLLKQDYAHQAFEAWSQPPNDIINDLIAAFAYLSEEQLIIQCEKYFRKTPDGFRLYFYEQFKKAFLQQLITLERISTIPNADGQRIKSQQQHQQWKEQLLTLMQPKTEKNTEQFEITCHSSICGTSNRLHPKYVQRLIQENRLQANSDFNFSSNSLSKNHLVFALDQFVIKVMPDFPVRAYAIHLLSKLIHGNAHELELIQWCSKQNTYAVLIAEKIEGITLYDALEKTPNLTLNFPSFCESILISLLINPEDENPHNFIVQQKDNEWRLHAIDQDRAFVKSVEGTRVYTKSILFMFDAMLKPIDPEVRKNFSNLNPEALLYSWEKSFQLWQQHIIELFEKKTVLQKGSYSTELQWNHLPIQILFEKITALQHYLKKNEQASLLDLLGYLEPQLANHCQTVLFDPNLKTPIERFDKAFGKEYQSLLSLKFNQLLGRPSKRYTTTLTPATYEYAATLSQKEMVAPNLIKQLKANHELIERAKQAFEKGDLSLFKQLQTAHHHESILKGIENWQQFLRNWPEQTRKAKIKEFLDWFITRTFFKVNFPFCDSLTDDHLTKIIDQSRHLKKLNLSGCIQLSEKSITTILKAKKLVHLNLSACTQFKKFSFNHLPELKRVYLSNNNITELNLSHLPFLEEVDISYCTSLTTINLGEKIPDTSTINWIVNGSNPQLVEWFYARAKTQFNKEQYQNAIFDLNKAITLTPKNADYFNLKGEAHFKQNQYDLAENEFLRAIEIHPDNQNYYQHLISLSNLYYEQKKYEAALQCSQKTIEAIKNKEWKIMLIRLKIKIYKEQRQSNLVEKEYLRLIELDPNDANNYEYLAHLYHKQTKYPEAIQYYQLASQFSNNDLDKAKHLGQKGKIYFKQKQYDFSEKEYLLAIKFDPHEENYYNELVHLYQNRKKYDEVLKYCQQAFENTQHNHSKTNFLKLKIEIYEEQNQFDATEKEYLRIIELNLNNPYYYEMLAYTYSKQAKYEEALNYYQKAFEITKDNFYKEWLLRFKIKIYKQQKQFDEVEKEYFRIIELNPNNSYYYEDLAYIYRKQEKSIQALKYFQLAFQYSDSDSNLEQEYSYLTKGKFLGAIKRNPNYSYYYGSVARFYYKQTLYHKQEKGDQALKYFQLAFQLSDNNSDKAEYLFEKGKIYLEQEQDHLAENEFLTAIKHDFHHSYYYEELAKFYSKQKKYDKTIEYLQLAFQFTDNDSNKEKYLYQIKKKKLLLVNELNPNNSKLYGNLADFYREEGNSLKAIKYFQLAFQFSDSNSNKASYLYQKGNIYFEREQYGLAEKEYLQVIKFDSETPFYYEYLAHSYCKQTKYERAAEYYQLAFQFAYNDSDKAMYLSMKGEVYLDQEQYQSAESEFLNAIQYNPGCPYYYRNLSNAYYKQKKYDDALKLCQKVLETIESGYYSEWFLNLKITIHQEQNQFAAAENALLHAIELEPTYTKYYQDLTKLYYKQKKYDDALKYCQKALETIEYTLYKEPFFNLKIAIYQEQNRFDALENELLHIIELSGKYYEDLAEFYYKQKKYDNALKYYQQALICQRIPPINERIYESEDDDWNPNFSHLKTKELLLTIELNPNNPKHYENLAQFYQKQGNDDEATKYFQLAFQCSDNDLDKSKYLHQKGQIYIEQNKYDLAEKEYLQTIELDPKNSIYYERLSDCYYKQKKYDKTIEYFQLAFKCSVKDLDKAKWLYQKGNIYSEQNKYDLAEKEYLQTIELDPKNSIYYERLSDCYYKQKKYEKAIEYFQLAFQFSDNDSKRATYLVHQGMMHLEQKQYELAERKALLAIKFCPYGADPCAFLSKIYFQQKKYDDALKYCHYALEKTKYVFYEECHYFTKKFICKLIIEIYEAQNQLDVAESGILRFIERHPNNPDYYKDVAEFYRKQKKYENALKYYQKAFETTKDNFYKERLLRFKIQIHQEQNQFDALEKEYLLIIELNPNNSYYYAALAYNYRQQKKYTEALKYFQLAFQSSNDDSNFEQEQYYLTKDEFLGTIKHNPNYSRYYEDVAEFYSKQKKYDKTLEYLQIAFQFSDNDSNKAQYLYRKGNIYFEQEQYHLAENAYLDAIKLDPDEHNYYEHLADSYYHQKKYDELDRCQQDFESKYIYRNFKIKEKKLLLAIELNPTNSKHYENLAEFYQEQEKYDEAAEYYQLAFQFSNHDDSDKAKYLANQGSIYFDQKKYDLATKEYFQATELEPKNTTYYYALAASYYKQKKYDEAAENYQLAFQFSEKNDAEKAHYLNTKGNVYFDQEQYRLAENAYLDAIKLDPNRGNYEDLATMNYKQKKYDKALKYCQKGFEITKYDSRKEWFFRLKIAIYQEQNHFDIAENELLHAIELYLTNEKYYEDFTKLYYKQKKYDDALKYCQKALETIEYAPDKEQFFKLKIAIYQEQNRFDAVENELLHIIELYPINENYYAELAEFYYKQKKYDKALQYYHQALIPRMVSINGEILSFKDDWNRNLPHLKIKELLLTIELNPNNSKHYENLAEFYQEQKNYDEAIKHFQLAFQCTDNDSDKSKYLHQKGKIYLEQEQYDLAEEEYLQVIKFDPETPLYYENLAYSYYRQNKNDKALEYLQIAFQLASNDSDKVKYLDVKVTIYCEQNKYGLAEKEYLQAIELNAKNPIYYGNLAHFYYKQKKYNDAIKYYQFSFQFASNDSDKANYLNWKGFIYYEQNKYDLAEKEYLQAIELIPENPIYQCNLANSYHQQKKYDKAIEYYQLAFQFASNDSDKANYLNWKGIIYYEQNKYDLAKKEYFQAIRIYPKAPIYYYNLGNCYQQQKKYGKAIKYYQLAIQLDDKNPHFYAGRAITYYALKNFEDCLSDCIKAIQLDSKKELAYTYYRVARMLMKESTTTQSLGFAEMAQLAFEQYQKRLTMLKYKESFFPPYYLGRCYELGIGTEKNLELAKTYYHKALHSISFFTNDDKTKAKKRLEALESQNLKEEMILKN